MSQPPQSGARPVNSLSAVSAPSHQAWLEQTLQLALTHRQQGGRPFAALLVRDNQLVASAVNRMLEAGDPSRHAELEVPLVKLPSPIPAAALYGAQPHE